MTVGTLAKGGGGIIEKVLQPTTACREANYSRDIVSFRDDSSSRDNRNMIDVTAARPPESDSRNSRDIGNITDCEE
jgi:hypothetical protein